MAIQESYYRLARDLPVGWTAKEVLVLELSFDHAPGGKLTFKMPSADVHTFADGSEQEPSDIFQAFAAGGLPPPASRPLDPARRKWLGVPVRSTPSLVFVKLAASTPGWRFRASGPAVTAKEDPRQDTVGPWHFDGNGHQLPNDAPGDGCKIIAFAVVKRDAGATPSFNLHLDLAQDDPDKGRWLEIMIDPDVPETGQQGFPIVDKPA